MSTLVPEPRTAEDRDHADLLAAFTYRHEPWLTARDIAAETGLGEFDVRSRITAARRAGIMRAVGVSPAGATLFAPTAKPAVSSVA